MEINKVQLRLKIDNLGKRWLDGSEWFLNQLKENGIDPDELKQNGIPSPKALFSAAGIDTDKLKQNGIDIDAMFKDELSQNTINNGYNLLRAVDRILIIGKDKEVVRPLSKIIGQYLFRLLFGTVDQFNSIMHFAETQFMNLEVVLQFDPYKLKNDDESNDNESTDDSKINHNLPWELMYCPSSKKNKHGFYISEKTLFYRKYKENVTLKTGSPGILDVSVAFLTKEKTHLLADQLDNLKKIGDEITKNESRINFDFINDKYLNLPDFEEKLSKIFPSDSKHNKVVHLICDIGKTENDDPAFFFDYDDKPKSFDEIIKNLLPGSFLKDPNIKLIVLQLWKDDINCAYSHFEDFACRLMKRTDAAVITMPYEFSPDGHSWFFELLYRNISNSMSILKSMKNLRNSINPKFSLGFPICYINGEDEILLGQETKGSNIGVKSPGREESKKEKEIKARLAEITKQVEILTRKRSAFETDVNTTDSTSKKFEAEENIKEIDKKLENYKEEEAKLWEDLKKLNPGQEQSNELVPPSG